MQLFIGIDPGKGGGIAALNGEGKVITTVKMPATERDVYSTLYSLCFQGYTPRAIIEKVSSSPQMGVVSAFTFGRGYGSLLMALTAADIPFDEIRPMTWQKALGCLSGGDKNVTKRRAQQIWPTGVTVTHAIADALLLADYCRRCYADSPSTPRSGKVRG